jgi:DHA3 family macrolide efflux protein-like MFS transporter
MRAPSTAGTLQPILVTKHFGGGALQLGWSNSAWGAGVILGGLVLSVWGGFRRRVLTSMTGLVGLGLGAGAVGLAPAHLFAVGLAGLFIMGFMNPIVNGPLMATVQAKAAPEMQGRVFTIMQALAGGMMPLSMAIAGPVADALGVQVWFLIGGFTCIAMGIGALFVPSIMNLEARAEPLPAEAAAD